MFNNKRYVTKGITSTVPIYLQNALWYLIETMEVNKKDRLQVFELRNTVENGKHKQKILHRQEDPPYSKEHIITLTTPLNAKIFVIDEHTHSTMLLAEEY